LLSRLDEILFLVFLFVINVSPAFFRLFSLLCNLNTGRRFHDWLFNYDGGLENGHSYPVHLFTLHEVEQAVMGRLEGHALVQFCVALGDKLFE
jgi:hypothetical protein